MITEQQYQRLMKEHAKSGVLGTAAMKAGMHRETAAKYLAAGQGPQPEKRRGRRRPDPLTTIWAAAERLLNDAPELEAKAFVRTPARRWRRARGAERAAHVPTPGAELADATMVRRKKCSSRRPVSPARACNLIGRMRRNSA